MLNNIYCTVPSASKFKDLSNGTNLVRGRCAVFVDIGRAPAAFITSIRYLLSNGMQYFIYSIVQCCGKKNPLICSQLKLTHVTLPQLGALEMLLLLLLLVFSLFVERFEVMKIYLPTKDSRED